MYTEHTAPFTVVVPRGLPHCATKIARRAPYFVVKCETPSPALFQAQATHL